MAAIYCFMLWLISDFIAPMSHFEQKQMGRSGFGMGIGEYMMVPQSSSFGIDFFPRGLCSDYLGEKRMPNKMY